MINNAIAKSCFDTGSGSHQNKTHALGIENELAEKAGSDIRAGKEELYAGVNGNGPGHGGGISGSPHPIDIPFESPAATGTIIGVPVRGSVMMTTVITTSIMTSVSITTTAEKSYLTKAVTTTETVASSTTTTPLLIHIPGKTPGAIVITLSTAPYFETRRPYHDFNRHTLDSDSKPQPTATISYVTGSETERHAYTAAAPELARLENRHQAKDHVESPPPPMDMLLVMGPYPPGFEKVVDTEAEKQRLNSAQFGHSAAQLGSSSSSSLRKMVVHRPPLKQPLEDGETEYGIQKVGGVKKDTTFDYAFGDMVEDQDESSIFAKRGLGEGQ